MLSSMDRLSGADSSAAPHPQLPPNSDQTEEADRDVRDLRYAELQELLKAMPEGVDGTYLEGISF